ncbi:hypothetical protein EHS17_03975 [Rhodobacteraceae bacterium CH30]|nr:hypothetical protein EHS17_03975 [Rhodobacteraceae bacterium CH30]
MLLCCRPSRIRIVIMYRISFLLLSVVLLGGCASSQAVQAPPSTDAGQALRIGAADNGLTLQMQRGQRLLLAVPATPSTGYVWQASGFAPVLAQQGEAQFVANGSMPGSGGVETWSFVADKEGISQLRLRYLRPWEAMPLRELNYRVEVN